MLIPCLFITFQRLKYTEKALQSVLDSDIDEVFIWDNNSTDGTAQYLITVNNPKIKRLCFHHENAGIRTPMNWFIDQTKDYEFVVKCDNDTLIPKDFCKRMLPHMDKADVVQAKHAIISATCPGGWDEFVKPMRKEGDLYFHRFVGGSGIMIRRSVLSDLPHTDWMLYSWQQWQRQHPEVIKAFANDVEISLLDQNGYHDYPSYYKMTKRL